VETGKAPAPALEPQAEPEPEREPEPEPVAVAPAVAPAVTPAVAAAAHEAEPAEQKPNNKHWYVVKVQSGREETIKEAIERKVKIEGLEEYFGRIYIPTEKVTEMRKNKRYTRERKILPGYIMAEVEYNDRILYLFRETSGVGDFVGAQPHSNRPPTPMTQREVERWMKVKGPDEPTGRLSHDYTVGDRVRVKDGMFTGMEGEVKETLEAKIKVGLTIFGREVPVELEYWQIEHV
jgi:transcriptional antiterminator NusG